MTDPYLPGRKSFYGTTRVTGKLTSRRCLVRPQCHLVQRDRGFWADAAVSGAAGRGVHRRVTAVAGMASARISFRDAAGSTWAGEWSGTGSGSGCEGAADGDL